MSKIQIAYSDSVYSPESLFANWLNLSYVLLTTALLFYHMSRVNSIKASPKLSAFIAASLVIISSLYMLYSLAPYIDRMNHVIRKCKKNKYCSINHLNIIISERNSYVILGILTSIIQLIITWLIIKKEFIPFKLK